LILVKDNLQHFYQLLAVNDCKDMEYQNHLHSNPL
jgi:hypothetical protein